MKLITWNIQWGLGADGVMDPARIVAHARSLADFDVLCLQEIADNFPELAGTPEHDQFRCLRSCFRGSMRWGSLRSKSGTRLVAPSASAT